MPTKDFYLKKRGEIWYVSFRTPEGEILTARSSGLSNKTAAEAWARKELPNIGSSRLTLHEWASVFFIDDCPYVSRIKDEGKPYSKLHQENNLSVLKNYILPDPICKKVLADLSKNDILAFRTRLIKKTGRARVAQRVMSALRVIIKEAQFRDMICKDLFAGVGQITYDAKERPALSLDGMAKLLNPAHYEYTAHWLATSCAAYTGMRAGEIRGLTWADLDKDKGLIHIVRSVPTHCNDVSLPKWGKKRSCPYPLALQRLLEPARGAPDSLVFSIRGSYLDYHTWAKSIKKIGVKGATLHVLRHTLTTLLRQADVSPEMLKGSFGWADDSMIDNYTHRQHFDYSKQSATIDSILGGLHESD